MPSKPAVLLTLFLVWFAAGEAHARRWTVNRRALEAELLTVVGDRVLVRLRNGQVREIPAGNLSPDDIEFVRGQLALRRGGALAGAAAPAAAPPIVVVGSGTERLESLLERSLDVQTAHYLSQWNHLWIVQFARPDGSLYWVGVLALDSYTAMEIAVRRDPVSHILFVKRLRKR